MDRLAEQIVQKGRLFLVQLLQGTNNLKDWLLLGVLMNQLRLVVLVGK
jgi:hypothetical protein